MDNSKKIILDLCGGTGSWSKPYKEAGYDVRLITLPKYDVLNYKPPKNVYGILAAPPCTEFSVAKTIGKRDFKKGMETVMACLEIIWKCRLQNKLKFWAMENPTGFLRQFIGIPNYTFYQWWFGDMGIKRTDIWGYFNEPKQKIFNRPNIPMYKDKNGKDHTTEIFKNPKCPEEYKGLGLNRAAIRAITPPGFAKAFFKANK